MHIEFKSITLNRFRSFVKETTLHFDNAGVGLYFLKGKNNSQKSLGSNGAGKSSLLDALSWCLYGKTVQGLKNPDVVPWTGKGTTFVELTIAIDQRKHIIERTINPNLLTIDGKEVGQEYIEKLIPIPQSIIPYTIVMGQRQPLFFDLKPSEKLSIFAEPLNLERWEVRSTHATELVKNLEIEIAIKEREIDLSFNQLKTLLQDIESIKSKKLLWEKDRSQALEGKDDEREQLEKKLVPLIKQQNDIDLALDRAETELRALDLSRYVAAEGKAANTLSLAERAFDSASKKDKDLRQMIDAIKEQVCPTCHQAIKTAKTREQLIKNIESQIADLNLKKLASARISAFKQHEEEVQVLNFQSKASVQFKKEAENARDELDRLLPQIVGIEGKINLIDKSKEEYENQNNPYSDQLVNLRKRKSQLETTIDVDQKKLESKKEYCERVRPWIKWFKEIKLYTLEEILQELQLTTNSMLEEFGLVGWNIQYDVERETKSKTIARGLNITVYSPSNSKPVKWESWSGGEAQRLRIIGSIALGSVLLNHLGMSTNLAVLDEPTESLSKEGVVDLVELLSSYAKDSKKNVILIDHHAIESDKFVDVIEIQKDKNGSCIL